MSTFQCPWRISSAQVCGPCTAVPLDDHWLQHQVCFCSSGWETAAWLTLCHILPATLSFWQWDRHLLRPEGSLVPRRDGVLRDAEAHVLGCLQTTLRCCAGSDMNAVVTTCCVWQCIVLQLSPPPCIHYACIMRLRTDFRPRRQATAGAPRRWEAQAQALLFPASASSYSASSSEEMLTISGPAAAAAPPGAAGCSAVGKLTSASAPAFMHALRCRRTGKGTHPAASGPSACAPAGCRRRRPGT